MVLESGVSQEREERYELSGPLPPLAIPATLHDSLMARLDRLATVKALAQLGATLGREFAYDLLQAVAPWDEATLRRGLQQLVEAEFLYQQGLPPQATYVFKHALIQEAAYQSLLKSTRQQYHQRIAQVVEARFPKICALQAEFAGPSLYGGRRAQAVPYWQRAGQRAIERSAHVEAINHLTKGLELLTTLPDTAERTQHELDFLTALGPALMATKGYAAPEVVQAYTRARELCQQIGERSEHFLILWNLWLFYLVRAEHQAAMELGEQCLQLAQSLQDETLLLEAQRQGLDMYQSTGAEFQRPHFLTMLAEASGLLGQPEDGLAALEEALTLMEQTGERYYEAELHRQRGELLLLQAEKSHPAQGSWDQHDAETCFQQALDVSRRQEAKALELRATMSLARLWQQQGKRTEAYDLLAPVYGWFTEGFNTADLQEARALLEALA